MIISAIIDSALSLSLLGAIGSTDIHVGFFVV